MEAGQLTEQVQVLLDGCDPLLLKALVAAAEGDVPAQPAVLRRPPDVAHWSTQGNRRKRLAPGGGEWKVSHLYQWPPGTNKETGGRG